MFDFKLGLIATVLLTFSVTVRSNTVKFDVFTLAQSWPQTSCWDLNGLWSKAETATCSPCKMPTNKRSWTIHGLWPSKKQGKHPSYCNTDAKFNVKLLNNKLRSELIEKWPSYKMTTPYESFWAYEWMKHGTCALNVPSTSTVPKYFNKSLQLIDKYNIGKVLADSGILPGNKYSYKNVIKVLQNSLNVNVYVKCAVNSMNRKQYLNEISICFDTNFELADCSNGGSQTNCKASKDVEYPMNLNTC